MVREDNNEERKEALLPTDTDENTQSKKARTIGGVYQDLKRISQEKGVDLGFGDETEESFSKKYGTGRGDEQLYNKLKDISKETGLDLGLPDSVIEWKDSLIRGDEQGTSKPSLDGVERPAAAGTEQTVEKSPYEELFRRADERREQRRREAEALKPQESAQEIEARHERLRKAAAISDAVAAIGNVLWTGRGSKQVYDPRQSMSEAAKKRYAERMARYDKQQQAWLRAREAYERGENTIENLRLRAMEYEDRRKAREADNARRERESDRRIEALKARMKYEEQKAADQHEKEQHNIKHIDALTNSANATASSTTRRANAQVRNVNNQIKNRDSRTQQQNRESEDRIRKRADKSGEGGGSSVRAERYTKAAQGVVEAGKKAAGGGNAKTGGNSATGKTGKGSAKSKFSIHSKK